MSDNIIGKVVTNVDNVSVFHIQRFSCKPEKGDLVEVLHNGKPLSMEVCCITHKWEKTHNGYEPLIEVEVTKKQNTIL